MSLFLKRSTLAAAGLAGALLAYGPAGAVAPGAVGVACAGSASAYERLACRSGRSARRTVRGYRPMVAEARLPFVGPPLYGPGRYASLLILGVAY